MIERALRLLLAVAVLTAVASPQDPPVITPVPATAVHLDDPFWAPRLERNRAVTIPHVIDECYETGRIANFLVAAARERGGMTGYFFNDSDVYKLIEGAGRVLATGRDAALEERIDTIIDAIAGAQEPDGYLYSSRTILDPKNMPPGGVERWSDLGGGHELYCVGHLYEGAVAYAEATGKTKLLDVALKNAELVLKTFGPGRNPYPDGHPEIELGFVALYRHTGDRRFLEQAKWFVDARGRGERSLFGEYAQDHRPVVDQDAIVGHAVRAAYLFAGTTDVGRLTGDRRYVDASRRLWEDMATTQVYLTGGIGSTGNNEGFGARYQLPNLTAYNETCASIANALWSWRLFLATGESRYVDMLERVVFNAFGSGWSLSGHRFFYPNPLESRGAERGPWFGCACCPPNVNRFVPQIPGFAYATAPGAVYVNLFAQGEAHLTVDGGAVELRQTTRYPWDGHVRIEVVAAPGQPFALRLRIPGWASHEPLPGGLYRFLDGDGLSRTLQLNGEGALASADSGYAVLERRWQAGDVVEWNLPMPVRRVLCDERVEADRGLVALQRGPIVYCFEGVDQPLPAVRSMVLPDDAPLSVDFRPDLLGGVAVVRTETAPVTRELDGSVRVGARVEAQAIPYFAWANRGRTPMAVWMARTPAAAKPGPAPTLAHRANASSSFGGDLAALSDQIDPKSSIDHDNPFAHWWPRKGTTEWVQYDLPEATTLSGVDVYWFDDTGRGECRIPKSWKCLVRVDGAWREVEDPSGYGVAKDAYQTCAFTPVRCDAVRIEVTAQDGWAGGIHEWRLRTQDAPAIPNGAFEQRDGDHPVAWFRSGWAGAGEQTVVDGAGRGGSRCVRIASERGADIAWSCNASVLPFSRYRLTGWIRTVGVNAGTGKGAQFNIHGRGPEQCTPSVTGDSDWRQVSVVVDTGADESLMINCLFGGFGQSTGEAFFDDVALELLEKGAMPAPTIRVDAARRGTAISKYVYGQFIEHLGRCIQGGIWAEMLPDRKFFHDVGSADSPWQVTGAGTVAMDTSAPFVGAHTPVLTLAGAGGLRHGALALTSGTDYVGRVWLRGDAACGAVTVAIAWGQKGTAAVELPAPGGEWTKREFRLRAGATTDDGALTISAAGRGTLAIGAVSLMPADNVQGMRADTLALLRELDAPVYRWPGGNFVSGYDWRDGTGDRDRRPPRKNPAWQGIESNDFGLHEFMAFCRLLGTDPYIAVNAGSGEADAAAAEVQYCNGAADTPMGRLRAQNGDPAPFGVKIWGIGNEMYGGWQIGHVPVERYTQKHNRFAEAMRAVDPSITLVAVGAVGGWDEAMLRDCEGHLTHFSEHIYVQERQGLYAHVRLLPDAIRHVASAWRGYRERFPWLVAEGVRIAMDEWNHWYGPHVFGELGTRYFLKDGLGVAAGLHEYFRNSDLFWMANYAQTVNVIGCIKTSPRAAAFETTGLALMLYRRHFGTIPVAVETTGMIDAAAAWTADGTKLTLGIVNATRETATIPLAVAGVALVGTGTRYAMGGTDPMAFDDPDLGSPIGIEESAVTGLGGSVTVGPCSVTLLVLDVRR